MSIDKLERRFIAYCMALLAVLFLSSIVPVEASDAKFADRFNGDTGPAAGGNPFSGATGFTVELEKEFPTTQQPPVEHTDFDISAYLDDWYVLYALQLKFAEIEDEEDRKREERAHQLALKQWKDGWEMFAYIMLMVLCGFGLIGFLHHRKP